MSCNVGSWGSPAAGFQSAPLNCPTIPTVKDIIRFQWYCLSCCVDTAGQTPLDNSSSSSRLFAAPWCQISGPGTTFFGSINRKALMVRVQSIAPVSITDGSCTVWHGGGFRVQTHPSPRNKWDTVLIAWRCI